jgi:hypothetical protein
MPSPVSFLFIHPNSIPHTTIFLILYSRPLQALTLLGNFDFKASQLQRNPISNSGTQITCVCIELWTQISLIPLTVIYIIDVFLSAFLSQIIFYCKYSEPNSHVQLSSLTNVKWKTMFVTVELKF